MAANSVKTPSRRGARPRVVHLLSWSAGCAVGFATYLRLGPWWGLPPKTRTLGQAYDLVMGASLGAILAGSALVAYRRRRSGPSLPMLPGHWLLMLGLAAALSATAAVAVFHGVAIGVFHYGHHVYYAPYWTIFHMAHSPNLLDLIHQATGWGLGAVASLAFCWHLRRRWRWPWLAVFFGFALSASALAGGSLVALALCYGGWGRPALVAWSRVSVHLYAGLVLGCALLILAAAARDGWRRSLDDGLHLTGALVWLSIAAIQIATYFLLMWLL